MKKKLVVLLSGLILNSNVAFSSGIPTVDVAAIQNGVQMLQEAQNQLKELQDQVNTAKSQLDEFKNEALEQKRRLEGYMDYMSMFDSSAAYVQDFTQGWEDTFTNWDSSNYKKMKAEYGFNDDDDDVKIKLFYEEQEKKLDAKNNELKRIKKETDDTQDLIDKFKDAETPAQREELANAIAAREMQMKIAREKLQALKEKQKLEEEQAKERLEIQKINRELEHVPFKW